jgi:hypothetical protein
VINSFDCCSLQPHELCNVCYRVRASIFSYAQFAQSKKRNSVFLHFCRSLCDDRMHFRLRGIDILVVYTKVSDLPCLTIDVFSAVVLHAVGYR